MTDYNMTPFKNVMVNTYIGAQIGCVSKLKYHLDRVNMVSNASRDDAMSMEILSDMGLTVDDLQHETQQLSRWKWAFQVILDETGEVINWKGEVVKLGIDRAFNYCAKENKRLELLNQRKRYSDTAVFNNRQALKELAGVEAEAGIPKGFYDWIADMATDSNKVLKKLSPTDEIKEQIAINDDAIAACMV
jgi:hypothetical protein